MSWGDYVQYSYNKILYLKSCLHLRNDEQIFGNLFILYLKEITNNLEFESKVHSTLRGKLGRCDEAK